MNLKEFENILTDMSERSQAFLLVKKEMQKRGHWKNKSRGLKKPLRNLAGAVTHSQKSQQSNDFSEGL